MTRAGENKTTYPITFRTFSFGDLHRRLTSDKTQVQPGNYARRLKAEIRNELGKRY